MKRNAVLTLAANYTLGQVEPFIASWREHVPSAELVIFALNCDEALYRASAQLGVLVHDAGAYPQYPFLAARHFIYRDFLVANARNFDEVLLSDSRDVVFQGDPFAVPRDRDVWFAAEDQIIGQCPYNSRWVRSAYGDQVAQDLGEETIACAGTTIGGLGGVVRYLDLICAEAIAHEDTLADNGDQGLHNYILRRLRPDFIGLDAADHVVQTVGYTPADRIAIVSDRVLVNGAAAPVVHQWDRHALLNEHLARRYRLDPGLAA